MVSSLVFAELDLGDLIEKAPPLKQGIAYSLVDHDISYLSTIQIIDWKGISLEAGYSSKDKAVAVISYELLKLKELGVNVPILDLIEARVGGYFGYGPGYYHRLRASAGMSAAAVPRLPSGQ